MNESETGSNVPKVKIVDSIMGSGKTLAAVEMIKNDKQNNYIYITPYLSEITRLKALLPNFIEPEIGKYEDDIPFNKLNSFHMHLDHKRNIISTHCLFKRISDAAVELIQDGQYILVLDEVLEILEIYDKLKKNDLDLLFKQELLFIKNGYLCWNEDNEDFDSRYNDLKFLCQNKHVMIHNNTVLVWAFPIDIFKSFQEVYILTYMFEGQYQKYYFDLFNVKYEYYHVENHNGVYVFKQGRDYGQNNYSNLINIIDEERINSIGDKKHALSVNWYTRQKKGNNLLLKKLKKNVTNFFTNKVKGGVEYNLWTCFKEFKKYVGGKGYTEAFISCNKRATNEYKHKKNLAYLINVFPNPNIIQFFHKRGIVINDSSYALAELLQWIWRSQIREYNPITIYIPSSRMRDILNKWLNT